MQNFRGWVLYWKVKSKYTRKNFNPFRLELYWQHVLFVDLVVDHRVWRSGSEQHAAALLRKDGQKRHCLSDGNAQPAAWKSFGFQCLIRSIFQWNFSFVFSVKPIAESRADCQEVHFISLSKLQLVPNRQLGRRMLRIFSMFTAFAFSFGFCLGWYGWVAS